MIVLYNVLVIGLGEIGLPIFQMLKQSWKTKESWNIYGYDKDPTKTINKIDEIPKLITVMHICIPCAKEEIFRKIILGFVEQFKPRLLIIHSTVPPQTCIRLYNDTKPVTSLYLAHSPVRGTHTQMFDDIESYVKFVGGVDEKSSIMAVTHLSLAGFNCKIIGSSVESELAKLFETSYVATMIATSQEMHRISRHFGADFSKIMDIIIDTHKRRLDRPVFYPSVIGGHCLIPNIDLLNSVYDSSLFKWVQLSNEVRKIEITNQEIIDETSKCSEKFFEMRKWLKEKLGEEGKE